MSHTHYQSIGVVPGATTAQIVAAYRRSAMRLHPDRNRSREAHDAFVALTAAYQVLGDPLRRARYDASLGLPRRTRDGGEPAPDAVGLRDWLVRHGRISATASRPDPAAQPARAFVRTVRITLAEQVGGCRQEVDVAWVATCGDCAGSGRRHAHAHACEECTGTGRSFASGVSEPCLACGSTGAAPAPRCVACGGTGRIGRREKRTVAIPAGLRAGSLLPVAAGAPAADAGEPAALQLRIEFADDPQFRIDRFPDLAVELPVDAVVAGRGGRVQVPTLAGTRWIDVPAGVVDGTSLRLPAEGLADGAGARGVLVARVRLVRTVRDADVHAHADARSSCAHDAAARPRERPRSDASLRVS